MSEAIPFHQTVRRSTLEAHQRANHSPFMDALFDGRLAVADYARLVEQYSFVYGALESVSDAMTDDPVAGPFVHDTLRRGSRIAEDLAFFGVTDPEPLPATTRYAARIREVADWPGGFVAHHYTRYLGDVAGGQAVAALLPRRYGVVGGGTAFYDFSALGPVPRFREHYRALLDAAPWDDTERGRVVDEVRRAYDLNIAVFHDLWDRAEPAAA
ncbi:biliverdin-producing heme oxygenase [Actinomycetospora sp. TBRC 11914]|uniref:biliverdin-producing heme oxygenase n=1 Tax=Actinomycetospora sp. TBRC 11914 TaxID=2729387 RepID=UPI00289F8936|nr:biliverdin-producing heme oxygenase [Actinomycetospora sp. TBRC 11914]